jgi:hypothetical protein
MATATDLAGFLRNDEDCLTRKIHNWWRTYDGPCCFNVKWTPIGGSTAERLTKPDPITVTADPKGVDNLVQMIEDVVTDKAGLGPAPIGTLRVQGYRPGKSGDPDLDFSRTLRPPDAAGLGDPSLARVEGWLQEERRRIALLLSEQRQLVASIVTTQGHLAQALTTSATVRTASSASAELSGLGPLLALVVLVVAYPAIKEALGLPAGAPMSDVIRAARVQLGSATSEFGQLARIAVPDMARLPAPPPVLNGTTAREPVPVTLDGAPVDGPAASAPSSTPATSSPGDVLGRVAADPAYAAELRAELGRDVDRADALLAALGLPAPVRALIVAKLAEGDSAAG